MRSFAVGLRKDLDAVKAGFTQEWSNGCVEGFIHKLNYDITSTHVMILL